MIDADGMHRRHGVELHARERTVRELRVVEHEALDPVTWRGLPGLLPQRLLDFPYASEIGIHTVELVDAARVAVTVDEPGKHGHAACVDDWRVTQRQVAHIRVAG